MPVPRGDGAELRCAPSRSTSSSNSTRARDGIAVRARRRARCYERYGGEMDETSLHLSQSVGKSVLGLTRRHRRRRSRGARHGLRARGRAAAATTGATVRHLLDMTAAIDFVEDYAVVRGATTPPAAGTRRSPAVRATMLEYLPTIGPGRLVARRALALRHAEHGPARARRRARGGHAAGAGDQRACCGRRSGAERDAELTVDAAGHGHDRRRLLRHAARLRAARGAGRRRRSRHRPARLDRCARRGAHHGRRRRWSTPRATPTSGGSATGASLARGIHGQCIAVDPSGTVVAILSSWPDAVDERRDDRAARAHRPPHRVAASSSSSSPVYIAGGAFWNPRVSTSR